MSDSDLICRVRACTICEQELPLKPKPILQFNPDAKILVVGQAPGAITHEKGIPFDDPSGDRLRQWMGITREVFYDEQKLAIIPMGFCYPGKGKSGDLPPRKECAELWRHDLLSALTNIELTLVIGQYAQAWHLNLPKQMTLTETVKQWESFYPAIIPLPHPSPRNNIWLKRNAWFETELLPKLKDRVSEII